VLTFIIISVITILVIAFFAKKILTRTARLAYEKSLLKGDKKKADRYGKMYYLSLDEQHRKEKGIIDIDEKISDDFRAFTTERFCIF